MKSAFRPVALAIAASVLCALPVLAEPQVSLSWNSCTGPLDLSMDQPQGQILQLYASVIGMTDGHTAYQVWIKYGDANGFVPDAWRFDPDGCQANWVQVVNVSPFSSCPPFNGGNPSTLLPVSDLWPPEYGYPVTLMRAGLGVIYPAGVGDPDPFQRYHLVRFLFDHTYSSSGPTNYPVDCGDFATPLCFAIERAVWVDPYAIVNTFGGGSNGQTFVTFNGGGGGCGAVPAHPSTWGAIKAQYRM
jgi:hypothetical protein